MTQQHLITELQDLLLQVVNETTLLAETLAQQTSQIVAPHREVDPMGLKLTSGERLALQHAIQDALKKSHYSQGMGFASYCAGTQDQQDYWTLEWWYKKANQLQQAKLENYQNAQRFLDFRSFEWFHAPAQNQQPCIYGPYVDYICNGAYTITSAHPVLVNGQFIGVIAIDLLVSALEKIFMPSLKNIQQKAVIINDQARVITSNDVTIRTGTLLKSAAIQSPTKPAQMPFQLVMLS
ncbi:cache domain-containing protein [Acinetobacter calcoaceticus]|uniref:Cache domain-containing protein n=1 Tax=Acinetobacter calcoaceticus TaxID=471 RepID=A0A4R1XB61_ACICA|nr:cache domain-containing protein [Acinetobacter calcoaceticus]